MARLGRQQSFPPIWWRGRKPAPPPLTEFILMEGGGTAKPSFLAQLGVGGSSSGGLAGYILLEDGSSKIGLEVTG